MGVESEITAEEVTKKINDNTSLVLASMGSGAATIQYLFATDVLGAYPAPRHNLKMKDGELDGFLNAIEAQ